MKVKPILIVLLFGYFSTIISCSNKAKNTLLVLDRASFLMEQYPDSSFFLLDSIQDPESFNKELYNRYQLLYMNNMVYEQFLFSSSDDNLNVSLSVQIDSKS